MNNNVSQTLGSEDLELINKYARKTLTADDVYTFSVVLCDNDADRDFEYFTRDTLVKLSQMYVGVTGIYDHDAKTENQVARIYACKVEDFPEKTTKYGEMYSRLTAKAYIPVCEASKELIDMLDSGIKKEVSVGCCIDKCECSICGTDMRRGNCTHQKGSVYGGEVCLGVLKDPTDAYEWSFTAVPAQKNAGVIKSFYQAYDDSVSREEYTKLKKYTEELEKRADEGERYKSYLRLEVVKSGITAQIGIEAKLLESMVKGLNIDELLKLKKCFDKKTCELLPVRPQTYKAEISSIRQTNEGFSI
ncbi:MAG: hypothetical protein II589_08305 [Clostridia bacterium]|nr:hypothetical protein [Clostridia bacterium]